MDAIEIDEDNEGRGNDQLQGRSGNDTMTGGQGKDIFAFAFFAVSALETSSLLGDDLVVDFENGVDRIDVSGLGLSFRRGDADLDDGFAITQSGSDVVINVVGMGTLTLANTSLSSMDRGDFLGWG